jgi:hypothetical protein
LSGEVRYILAVTQARALHRYTFHEYLTLEESSSVAASRRALLSSSRLIPETSA